MSETLRDLIDRYFLKKKELKLVNFDKPPLEKLQNFAKEENIEVDIPQDKQILYTILWDMVMERVIKLTFDEAMVYKDITGFHLTEYGEKLLQGLPIDRPNQYLDYLTSIVPTIDPQIIVYVRESLDCYNLGCYFASSVMLGVAAEKLFELLISAYTNAIQNPKAQQKFQKMVANSGISQQYDEFVKKKLSGLTGTNGITAADPSSTKRLRKNFKHAIEITFDSIRSYRDYAAHPRNGVVPRHIIKGHLEAFPLFCQRVYEAIEWLDKNKV